MIGRTNFKPTILELLDAAQATVQNAVAPGGRTLLLARIVLISADIVLVSWREGDRRLSKATESEAGVLPSRSQELIAFEKFGEVVLPHGVDNDIPWDGVNSIIQVTIQDTDLMIHDHRTVTATSEMIGTSRETVLSWEGLGFEDGRNVIIAMSGLSLASRKMAINKAKRTVVKDEAEDQGTLQHTC
jgi:hypothetical protein